MNTHLKKQYENQNDEKNIKLSIGVIENLSLNLQ